jgi:hypothetical protein
MTEPEPAHDLAEADDERHVYFVLSRAAPNRLTVTTFFAGFTLAAFVGLFTVMPRFHHADATSLLVVLAQVLVATSTLLFILTAMATYVSMQRLSELSRAATDALARDASDPLRLGPRDAALLRDAQRIYDEPGLFVPWGLLLVIFGIQLIAWHIYAIVGGIITVVTLMLLIRTESLQLGLRHVIRERRLPHTVGRRRENPRRQTSEGGRGN